MSALPRLPRPCPPSRHLPPALPPALTPALAKHSRVHALHLPPARTPPPHSSTTSCWGCGPSIARWSSRPRGARRSSGLGMSECRCCVEDSAALGNVAVLETLADSSDGGGLASAAEANPFYSYNAKAHGSLSAARDSGPARLPQSQTSARSIDQITSCSVACREGPATHARQPFIGDRERK